MDEHNEIEEYAPWLLLAITLVGGFLRVLLIANKGLRMDETISLWVSSHNLADMLHWISNIGQNPPLYYLLLHSWITLNGETPLYIRQLSALLGTVTIPFIYLIGKRLSGVMAGLAAAVFLAFSPFNIRFAEDTTMYTLLMFNVTVAMCALVWLLTDPRSARPIGSQFREYLRAWRTPQAEQDGNREFSYKDLMRKQPGWRAWLSGLHWVPIQIVATDLAWVALIVFSVASLYSHNTAVLFLLASNIFVLSLMFFQGIKKPGSPPAFQAPSFWNWMKAQVAILFLWSPWIPTFIRQVGRDFPGLGILKPGWGTIVKTLASFVNMFTPGTSGQGILWVVYALVLVLGLVYFRKNISHILFLAAMLAIPFVGEWLASTQRPIFLDRTLMWTSIPVFALLGTGIAQIRFRIPILVVLGVLATVNLLSAGDYYKAFQNENWSDPAGFVAKYAQNGDLILFNASWAQIPFEYYFKPYEIKYFIQVDKHGAPADLFDSGVFEAQLTESDVPSLLSLIEGYKTTWLVYSREGKADPKGLVPQTLASRMKLIYTRDYYSLQVQIYTAP